MDATEFFLNDAALAEPSRRDWTAASIEERTEYLEREAYVAHPKLIRLTNALKKRWQTRAKRGKSYGILVKAVSGGGKTRFLKYLNQQFDRRESSDRTIVPLVVISIPVVCTLAGVCTAILRAMGEPDPGYGITKYRVERVERLIVECGVEIIAVDNVQDLPMRRSVRGVEQIGNFLRDLADLNVILLLLGTDEARIVVDSNPQLRRRVPGGLSMGGYLVSKAAEMKEMLRLIDEIDKLLPMSKPCGMAHRRSGRALAVASDGVIGHLINILSEAMRIADLEGRDYLIDADLEAAFIELFLDAAEFSNPFDESFGEWRRLTKPGEAHDATINPKAYAS